MNDDWKQFYEECLKYGCRHCNAQKGNPCQDTNLRKTKPHSARQEALRQDVAAWRRQKTSPCPTCGGKGRLPIVGADPRRLVPNDENRGTLEPSERTLEVPAADVGVLRPDVGVVPVEELPRPRDVEPDVPKV
jgi:hypothetical protein